MCSARPLPPWCTKRLKKQKERFRTAVGAKTISERSKREKDTDASGMATRKQLEVSAPR